MAKPKSISTYQSELKRMVKERTGKDCDPWLVPQLRATAMNMVMLDKIQRELEDESSLLLSVSGSMGQMKNEAHPLLAHYDKLQRTLTIQFEALGLNYRTTPSKVTENTKQGGEEHDKLTSLLSDITNT